MLMSSFFLKPCLPVPGFGDKLYTVPSRPHNCRETPGKALFCVFFPQNCRNPVIVFTLVLPVDVYWGEYIMKTQEPICFLGTH